MQEAPSEGRRFESRYGGGFTHLGAYLAEEICFRIARKEGKDLPHRFWELAAWKRHFKTQLLLANKLIKVYSAEAILRALRGPARLVYSLGFKGLPAFIEAEEAKLAKQQETLVGGTVAVSGSLPQPAFVRQSVLSRLREVDGAG